MTTRNRLRSVQPLHCVGLKQSINKSLENQEGGFLGMCKFLIGDQGTAAIEYALLISLIGMAFAGSLQALGGNVFDVLSTVENVLSSVQLKDDPFQGK